MATLALASCGSEYDHSTTSDSEIQVDGIPELYEPLTPWGGTCATILAAGAAVVLTFPAAGTLIVSKRTSDSAILLNGFDTKSTSGCSSTVLVTSTTLKTIDFIGSSTADTLILDFANGSFGVSTVSTPAFTANLAAGVNHIKFRGQATADTVEIGAADAAATSVKVRLSSAFVDLTVSGLTITAEDPTNMLFTFALSGGNDTFRSGPSSISAAFVPGVDDPYPYPLTVFGGEGNDTVENGYVFLGLKGNTAFNGGSGVDVMSYKERTAAVNVSLDGVANDGDRTNVSGGATVATSNAAREADNVADDVETITGGTGDDVLKPGVNPVTSQAVTLDGAAGNDIFVETVGAAISRKTVFIGGTGTDIVSYGLRTVSTGVRVTVGATADDGNIATSATLGEDDDVQSTVEIVIGSTGTDTLTGGTGNDRLCGHTGADTISGGAGDDTFSAIVRSSLYQIGGLAIATDAQGAVVVDALLCDDADADKYIGGAGVDVIDYSSRGVASKDPLTAATATPTAAVATILMTYLVAATSAGTSGLVSATEADKVVDDIENAIGTTGIDTITGNASNNVLEGGADVDIIVGGDGNDDVDCGADTETTTTCGLGDDLAINCDFASAAAANAAGCEL